ncbi:MAG: hypothetical protein GY835_21245 [bacterium]|nr:hypothetical protein [bacterium]
MIKVNLLPFEDRPKARQMPLPNKWSVLIYGLVVALLATAGGMAFLQGNEYNRKIAEKQELDAEQKILVERTKAIERLELRTMLLQERLNVVGLLENIRYDNVMWLNSINRVLPEDLWLTSLTRNEAAGRTTLEGLADGYGPVAKLMKSMELNAAFSEVQMIKSERSSNEDNSLIYFNVVANWGTVRKVAQTATKGGSK